MPSGPRGTRGAAGTRWTDREVELLIGRILQVGVLLAAAVVLLGGGMLLAAHGGSAVDFGEFRGQPAMLRSLQGIFGGVLALDGRAIVQLGLVLLVATPVARVALALVAFVVQRDRLYAAMSGLVLALLLAGLVFGVGH